MANIFRQLEGQASIFKDEKFLRPDFLPEQLPGREAQMKEIASYLQGAVRGKVPPSILLVGKPGTGKTSMARLLLKQLAEVSSKPKPIYINCWENSSRFGILNKLIIELGDMLPRRGIAADEVVSRLAEIGRRDGCMPIIILDEVDRLLAQSSREDEILYDLSRAQEALGLNASVIAITNDEQLPAKLDARVRSSLTNHTIYFEQYSPGQLKGILKERVKMAFWPGAVEEDALGLCAAVGAKAGGDARLTIHLLWAAAKKAEIEGSKKLGVAHVQAVKERSLMHAKTILERKEENLDEFDIKLVNIIKNCKEGVGTEKIYEKIGADESAQRTVRNHLAKLEKAGIIEMVESEGKNKVFKVSVKK